MGSYVLKRLISAIPVLLGITVIVFLIMAMIPGDPATAILGSYATPENVAKLNRDKLVRGVHVIPTSLFTLWGYWNLFYYPSLGQWVSLCAGVNVVAANTVWVVQMIHYIRKERRS